MNSGERNIEIALLGVSHQFDNYEDYSTVLRVLEHNWITVSIDEYEALSDYSVRSQMAAILRCDDIAVITRVPEEKEPSIREMLDKHLAKVVERNRKAKVEAEKRRIKEAERYKEREVAKARKALEKARKTLEAAGESV